MAKIVIEVPNQFADELGYQSVVTNPNYIPDVVDPTTFTVITPAVGEPTIPNPETKADFLKKKVPKIVAHALADKAVRVLERTKKEEIQTESEALRTTIETTIIST